MNDKIINPGDVLFVNNNKYRSHYVEYLKKEDLRRKQHKHHKYFERHTLNTQNDDTSPRNNRRLNSRKGLSMGNDSNEDLEIKQETIKNLFKHYKEKNVKMKNDDKALINYNQNRDVPDPILTKHARNFLSARQKYKDLLIIKSVYHDIDIQNLNFGIPQKRLDFLIDGNDKHKNINNMNNAAPCINKPFRANLRP